MKVPVSTKLLMNYSEFAIQKNIQKVQLSDQMLKIAVKEQVAWTIFI